MIPDNLDTALGYLYDRVPGRYPANQISKDAFNDDHAVKIDEIILYLQREGLIYKWVNVPGEDAYPKAPESYGLSIKGTSFFQNAKINKRPYFSAAQDDNVSKRDEKNEAFTEDRRKRKWFWFGSRKR